MTPKQKRLARHALGFQGGNNKVSYRNRYMAAPRGDAHTQWQAMVAAGDAEARGQSDGYVWFWLTRQGAEKALRKGESLCSEDFPPQEAQAEDAATH